jgi:hypothetical protein
MLIKHRQRKQPGVADLITAGKTLPAMTHAVPSLQVATEDKTTPANRHNKSKILKITCTSELAEMNHKCV